MGNLLGGSPVVLTPPGQIPAMAEYLARMLHTRARQAEYVPPSAEVKQLRLGAIIQPGWTTLPMEMLMRCFDMYHQDESWTCGLHSTARAKLMNGSLGATPDEIAAHFSRFSKTIPRITPLGIDIGDTSVGPTPSALASDSGGTHIGLLPDLGASNRSANALLDVIRNAILGEHPVVVLIKVPTRGPIPFLHYVNIVAFCEATESFGVLDTNNTVYTISHQDLVPVLQTYIGVHAITF